MRRITDHRFAENSFDEAIRGLVRGAPWWMTSLVAHALVLAVLWNLPFTVTRYDRAPVLQAVLPPDETPPEDIEDPPEPKLQPPETIVEKPLEPDDTRDVDEADTQFDEPLGDEGETEGVFTGPSYDSIIGIGRNSGGGKGRGGPKHVGGPDGGTGLTQNAVELGLKWLADHQDVDDDGRWDADEFMKHDPADDRCDGAGGALYDVGVTGLSLLAFLGAGYTDRGAQRDNPFARTVRRGLRYLMSAQDEDGVFGSRATHAFMYNHAIATLAMCEAYWMTRNPRYRKPAQEGLNFLAMARNPYMAWRYDPRSGENDTSVTGWCVMALKSGKFAGLEVDPDAFEGARLWVEKMTDPSFGQVGYNYPGGQSARPEGKQERFPAEKTQAMTAAGVLTRIFLGEDPRHSEMIRKGARLCVETPPVWNPDDGSIDMYYWYYGTLAVFQVGGGPWQKWNKAMTKAIVEHQHRSGSGSKTGSWDPIGCWGDDGGRVYATATMVMCLEVYYRYDRVFGTGRR